MTPRVISGFAPVCLPGAPAWATGGGKLAALTIFCDTAAFETLTKWVEAVPVGTPSTAGIGNHWDKGRRAAQRDYHWLE
jgi:hypothetical protein